jgi:phosphohistidine phosphatase SixA
MFGLRWLLLCVLFASLPAAVVVSQPAPPPADLMDALRLGGYVIVLRHGETNSDVPNADPMSNPGKKPAGERQLNVHGRAQARAIGQALRGLGIPVGLVMTSPLQRAVDTGTLLGFGDVTTTADLAEAGAAVSREENNRRAAALRGLVSLHPPVDTNFVIVTHKPNLIEAFGDSLADIREGEAAVFEPDFTDEGYRLMARFQVSDWDLLVQASHAEELNSAPHCVRPVQPNYD